MELIPSQPTTGQISDRQFLRILYSSWDFQQALSALTFLLEECDFDENHSDIDLRKYRCYESSMIMAFARPFESARGRTTLSLRSIGIKLNQSEIELKNKIMHLRRKIIAHSDEDEMFFKSTVIVPFEENPIGMPFFIYDESLLFEIKELRKLETFLQELKHNIAKYTFEVAQENPDLLEIYKRPQRLYTPNQSIKADEIDGGGSR